MELKQTITKKDLVKKLLKQEIDEESEAINERITGQPGGFGF